MTIDPKVAALEAELAANRARLAATVDELTTRLSPSYQADQAKSRARNLVRDAVGTDPAADPDARTKSRAVLGSGLAALALLAAVIIRRH